MPDYSFQVTLSTQAADHSEATQQATELSMLLDQAGYGHVSTVVLDGDGDTVAEFGFGE